MASPSPASVGQPVTLTATVTRSAGTAAPTGTVTFLYGSRVLNVANVGGSGVATYKASTNGLPVNTYGITAQYSGDTNYVGSTSPATSVSLEAAPTATALGASSNTVTPPASVTLTATVGRSASGAVGTPTGTVTFYYETFALGSAPLINGVATFTASSSGIGANTYAITAEYKGDSEDVTSVSTPVDVVVQ